MGYPLIPPNWQTARRVFAGKGRLDAVAATTTALNEAQINAPGGSSGGFNVFYFDPADWPTNSQMRVEAIVLTNATPSGATFTVGLYPVTAVGGAAANVTETLGTLITGSDAAIASPAASSLTRSVSSLFSKPAAGFYTLGVVLTTMAASSSVVVRGSLDVI